MRKRLCYAVLAILILAVEIIIAKYAKGFVRGSVGDILVVVLIFSIVRTIVPDIATRTLPLYVFLFSCFVELLQLFRFVELIGVQNNPILSTAIGGTFSFLDLLCYAVGSVICFAVEYCVEKAL